MSGREQSFHPLASGCEQPRQEIKREVRGRHCEPPHHQPAAGWRNDRPPRVYHHLSEFGTRSTPCVASSPVVLFLRPGTETRTCQKSFA